MTSTSNQPNTIVLIPGLWLSANSWEHWEERYQNMGFEVLARDWPGLDHDVEALRSDSSAVADIGFEEIVEHFETIVRGLDRPPIIMGHSFGGSVVEMLLDRGLGVAGVAIDPGPVKGVLKLPFAELKSASPGLRNPRNRHRAVTLTPAEFHYAFTNTMSDEESASIYERYAIPGPGKALFQAAFANFHSHSPTTVHFRNDDRAPLLLIAGELDHTAPVAVTRSEYKLESKSKAITGFKEFAGRSHFTIGQPGWEAVADFALEWALDPTAIDEGL